GGRGRLRLDPRGGDAPLPPPLLFGPRHEQGRGGTTSSGHPADRRRQGPVERGAGGVPHAGRGASLPDLAGQARRRDLPAGGGGAAAIEPALGGAAVAAVRARRGPPLRPALSPHPAAQEAGGMIYHGTSTFAPFPEAGPGRPRPRPRADRR